MSQYDYFNNLSLVSRPMSASGSQYVYEKPEIIPEKGVDVSTKTGSGVDWGQVGASAGASALSGIIQMMYQQAQEKRRREQELMNQQAQNAGQYGQNQNNMLGQLMGNWNKALGV